MDLQNLMEQIERHWPFDDTNYPDFAGLQGKARKKAILTHILFHQHKAVAKLVEAIEPADHGAQLNDRLIRQAIRNFFINTLRLASAAKMPPGELIEAVQAWAAEPHVP